MKNIAVCLVPFLLVACSSTPKTDSSQISQQSNANSASTEAKPEAIISSASDSKADIDARKLAAEKLAAERLAAKIQELQKRSIYFDFDQHVVKPAYQEVIRQQAEFIKTHKNDVVTIQGNADERGSAEYNLALGDNRADAARKNLELLGVSAAQIKTASLGEEKPRLTCHEEKCWQENRRDDFVHKLN